MNIVLIGMRGSGKSTIGHMLAANLGCDYFEMDTIIEMQEKMKISEIVEKFGWEKFRALEKELVGELTANDNAVIATGGGVVIDPENTEKLKENGLVIWLTADIDTLLKRIGDDPNRVSLTGEDDRRKDMEKTLKDRETLYKEAADCIISTQDKTEQVVIDEIIKCIKNHD